MWFTTLSTIVLRVLMLVKMIIYYAQLVSNYSHILVFQFFVFRNLNLVWEASADFEGSLFLFNLMSHFDLEATKYLCFFRFS